MIYARKDTTIPQQTIDQATTALIARVHGRARSIDEAIKAMEDHQQQQLKQRDWERRQARKANGRYR